MPPGQLAADQGSVGISRVGRCWWEVEVHLAAWDVRSPLSRCFWAISGAAHAH